MTQTFAFSDPDYEDCEAVAWQSFSSCAHTQKEIGTIPADLELENCFGW